MPQPPTLLLFPGLGADPRVFEPQRALPFSLELGTWPEPESRGETLAHYSHRVADAIGSLDNLYVGGVSLGAMVALEAAKLLNARGVILIGGCTAGRQISRSFRSVLQMGAAMPARFIRPSLLLAPLAFKTFERLSREHRRLMTRVLREHSPEQIRWSCRAILDWECCALAPDVPVHAIHGQEDEIIPLANVRADCVLPGGKHLINLQRWEEVNRFIRGVLRGERLIPEARSGRPTS